MTPSSPDRALIRRHLLNLDRALTRLEQRASISFSEYEASQELQWAVERGLLVCAQNVLDIAAHLAASAGRDSPDYTASIEALGEIGVLPPEFARAIRPLAGFRNVLVHAYLNVDTSVVHGVLTRELPQLREFTRHVELYLAGNPTS